MKKSKHIFTSILEVCQKAAGQKIGTLQSSECDENLYIVLQIPYDMFFWKIIKIWDFLCCLFWKVLKTVFTSYFKEYFSLSHYFYRIYVLSFYTVYVKFSLKSKDYLFPFWLKNWFFSLNSIKGIKKLPNLAKFLHYWANIGLETPSNFHLFWIKIMCLFAKFNFKITTFSQKWP